MCARLNSKRMVPPYWEKMVLLSNQRENYRIIKEIHNVSAGLLVKRKYPELVIERQCFISTEINLPVKQLHHDRYACS